MQPLKINLFQFQFQKHAPKKIKLYDRIQTLVLIRTLEPNNDQITSKKQRK